MCLLDQSLLDSGLIDPPPANPEGTMPRNHMVRIAEITDGTAHSMLLTEDAGRPQLWRAGRPVEGPDVPGGPWVSRLNRLAPRGSTPDGAIRPGPCAINCTNEQEVYSFHPGGANATFADGSVHFLKATIDIRIFAALVTRAGGEVVVDSDY
jgi:prepilin-type processing-associated H-X9-DG protein